MAGKPIVIKILGDTLGFRRSLKDADEAAGETGKALDKLADKADKAGDTVEKSGGRFAGVKKWFAGFRVPVDDAGNAIANVGDQAERSEGRLSRFGDTIKGKLGDGQNVAVGKLTDLSGKLREFGPVGEKAGDVVEGLAGKLGAMGPVAGVAAGGVTVVAGAMVALGAKSVAVFQETAAQVLAVKRATGLAAEDASRWVAAAGDMNISAEQLSGSFGQLSKRAMANRDALEELGVQVAFNADGSIDLSETAMRVADAMNSTNDQAKKAAIGNAAFGKSWQTLIPLLSQGRTGLRDLFKEAEDKRLLLDDEDLQAAEDLRMALDDLKEGFHGIFLTVGKTVVPTLAETVDNIAWLVDGVNKLDGELDLMSKAFKVSLGPIGVFNDLVSDMRDLFGDGEDAAKDAAAGNDVFSASAKAMEEALAAATEAEEASTAAAARAKEEFARYERTIRDVIAAHDAKVRAELEAINVELRLEGAIDRVEGAMQELIAADKEAAKAAREHGAASDEATKAQEKLDDATRDAKQAMLDQAGAAVALQIKLNEANGVTLTASQQTGIYMAELVKLRDQNAPGSPLHNYLDGLIGKLSGTASQAANAATELHNMNKALAEAAGAEFNSNVGGGVTLRAKGGPLAANQLALVGEEGPELVRFSQPSTVIPADKTAAMIGGGSQVTMPASQTGPTIIVNVSGVVGDERAVAARITDLLRQYARSTSGRAA